MCKALSIGDRIRIARLEADMSQEELAHALGRAGRSYISKIERNERDLDHGEVLKICEILDITPNYLFFGYKELLEASEQKLLDKYRELNAEGQEKLLDYADDLAASGRYKKDIEALHGKAE